MHPVQLLSHIPLLAARPPAWLWSPARTLPTAKEFEIMPPLSPTRPPTWRNATPAVPTFPLANDESIQPWLLPTSPPRLVECPKLSLPLSVPAAPMTFPAANAFRMMPSLYPTSPPAVPPDPTLTTPVAQVWPEP